MVHLGLATVDTPVFSTPHAEDLRGKHVLTDGLPFFLALYAEAITCVELQLPKEIDTFIAPWRALARFAQSPRTFVVSGSSREQGMVHAGGSTPLAAEIARAVMSAPKNASLEDLTSIIDQMMWGERKAGIESEKLFMRALAAERDRRLCAVAARMRPAVLDRAPGEVDSPPEISVAVGPAIG